MTKWMYVVFAVLAMALAAGCDAGGEAGPFDDTLNQVETSQYGY